MEIDMSLHKDIEREKRLLKTTDIVENFGQDRVRFLKDKHGYNPYGTQRERSDASAIDAFDRWCMNYDGR